MKLGIIGGGNMGEAILASVLRAKVASPAEIIVAEQVPGRRDALEAAHGVHAVASAAEAIAAARVLLAVKPAEFESVAAGIKGRLAPSTTVISIMAGVPIDRISAGLGTDAVVRAMPNTPAQVGEGMTVWTASAAVSEDARREVGLIFDAMGRHAYVAEEKYLDMATAVLGSGPGFVLLLIEGMIDAAVHVGMTRELATEVVLRTFGGTAKLALETGRHPADLRNMVTSPAGTTAEGLLALESAGVRAALVDAVKAAYNKSIALGGVTDKK